MFENVDLKTFFPFTMIEKNMKESVLNADAAIMSVFLTMVAALMTASAH
jgi:hypothetical protein